VLRLLELGHASVFSSGKLLGKKRVPETKTATQKAYREASVEICLKAVQNSATPSAARGAK